MNASTDSFQVVIVGGGPVGVGLAVDLGQRGISCALVERHRSPQRIPKGQNLTNRTLEHFYFWNCVDELRAARVMPPGYPIGGITAYGNLMSDFWFSAPNAGDRGQNVHDFFFQKNERLPQYHTEEVLRSRVNRLPSVTQLFGWTALSVDQDEQGVSVEIAPVDEDAAAFYSWSADAPQSDEAKVGGTRKLRAEYLVGCDGGRSLVRDSLGIDRGGQNFDQRMVLAVLKSRELHEGLGRFPECTTYRVLKPELEGYWQFFGRIDVGEGFFFHAPVPKNTRPDNYDFHALVQEAAGFPFDAEFEHVGFWDLRIMVASEYGRGRIFIAGDAAHQHPPYGGFGLNTGLEDATNLGWKLAARLQGWGGDALLDSYGAERRPVFVETGEAMIAGGIERDRDFLNKHDPSQDREGFEKAWRELGEQRRRQSYEPHYEGSPVVFGPRDGECSIHGSNSHEARAGHHLSPRTLSSGGNVFENLGPDLTLLALDQSEPAIGEFEAAAKRLNVPLKIIRDSFDSDRELYESQLILVRPDQYVAWASEGEPADATAVLRKAVGAE